jgi:photosystem II stability/assembly factor-like uncharacterized protein
MNCKTILLCGALITSLVSSAQLNWEATVVNASYHLYTIDAPSEDVIYTAGYNGSLLKSVNGGDSWQNLSIQASYITEIDFLDTQTGWLCAQGSTVTEPGVLHKTTDGGLTWTLVQSGPDYLAMDWVNNSIGYVGGRDGFFEKTTNGGVTWTQITLPNAQTIACIDFLDENHGFVTTSEHKFYRTSDGGQTWESISHSYIESVYFRTPLIGYCTTYYGKIGKTTNGGETFTYFQTPHNFQLREIAFENDLIGYVVGGLDCSNGSCTNKPVIMTTTDGGITWVSNVTPYDGLDKGYYDIALTPGGKPFIAGSNKAVLRLQESVSLSENSIEEKLLVYPNPANEAIHVKAPINGTVARIIDQTGRIVKEMPVQTGTETEIEVATLNAGVYTIHFLDSSRNSLKMVRFIKIN